MLSSVFSHDAYRAVFTYPPTYLPTYSIDTLILSNFSFAAFGYHPFHFHLKELANSPGDITLGTLQKIRDNDVLRQYRSVKPEGRKIV